MNNKQNTSARSWFCVLNNPQNQFGELDPENMVHKAIELWISDKPYRTCGINYEIGESGTPHMHMVLEDKTKIRFSAIKKIFPTIHLDPTKGTKEQAEDYIYKRGKFEDKRATIVVPPILHGEIKGHQGKRNDLLEIDEMISEGLSPRAIQMSDIRFRRYEKIIRKAYFDKRISETSIMRDILVYWHVGQSGSGKSYSHIELIEKYGEDDVYMMSDYENGGLDLYEGQKVLFMDEFKGNIRFATLLQILDKYKHQIHCRYSNIFTLWTEVHITSVYPPEEAYKFMVDDDNKQIDTIKQLLRRLTYVCYHYKDNEKYMCYTQSAEKYSNYESLIHEALSDENGFVEVYEQEKLPFD